MCQVVVYKRLRKIIMPSTQKVVAVAYERLSFTSGSNYRLLTGKNFGVLDKWSLMRGGRLREVLAHGGSTILCLYYWCVFLYLSHLFLLSWIGSYLLRVVITLKYNLLFVENYDQVHDGRYSSSRISA